MSKRCRCANCGRFVGINDAAARATYTPDSHFTRETVEWICGRCIKIEAKAIAKDVIADTAIGRLLGRK